MTSARLPSTPEELTLDGLNALLAERSPRITLTDFEVTEVHMWGDEQVSAAARIVIRPQYEDGRDLPEHLVLKVARTDPLSPTEVQGAAMLYQNEVEVCRHLQPADLVESPRVFGSAFDGDSSTFVLLMEDLRDRGATFGAVTKPVSTEAMRSLLDQLATLHARYWNSPQLTAELNWMETHSRGQLHFIFNTPEIGPAFVADQVNTVQFKNELVQRLRTTPAKLFTGFQRLQQHQSRLPQTICHGDTHIGNTYVLPGERGGLLDWQLCSQGYSMHDVSYLIATGLSVADRRDGERDLLDYYRERLLACGVQEPPTVEELWLEYRRAMVWGLYIGWLITPVVNYGWEINLMNNLRLATAFEDLETARLLDELS